MSAFRRAWHRYIAPNVSTPPRVDDDISLHPKDEDEHLLSDDDEFTTEEYWKEEDTTTYSVEDAVDHMGFGRFQLKVLAISGLFSMTDALEMQLLSVLSPMVRCEWALSEWKVAFITTTVFIGMFMGSHVWGVWADKYGRRPILVIAASWIGYFGLATTFSPSYIWLILLRGLVGLGFGGAVQAFTLVSEYMPSKHRAKSLVLSSFAWALGSSFEILLAYFILPTLGWRYLVAFSALPSFLSLFCLAGLPESARYLVAAGRKAEAVTVLEGIARMNRTTLPRGTLVSAQLVERGSFSSLFSKLYARTSIQLWIIWFATAFSYYGIILAQSEILEFRKVCGAALPVHEESNKETCYCNLLHRDDYISIMIATFGEYLAIPINLITIDYLGRKRTLCLNFTITAVFFLLIQLCTGRFLLTMFIFGVRAFGSGIFNTVYIYTSEVYPTTVRSLGLGSCSASARLGAMLTPFVAQVVLQWSLVVSLWIYAGVCLICAVVSILLPIETRGRVMPETHNQR